MTKPKPLSKEMILAAMARTRSNRAAARYLSVSFVHYKKWAKLYKDEASGLSLWEKHKNQAGTGIPKFLTGKSNEPALIDIIEGRATPTSFTPQKVKTRLILEGYLLEECSRVMEHWLKEYKVDGYRFDLSKGFTQNNTGSDVAAWGRYDASRVAIWKRYYDTMQLKSAGSYVILEHFADNLVQLSGLLPSRVP